MVVAVVYVAIAGVLALRGKKRVKQATPPVPERAVDSTKEDLAWLKTRAKSRRSGKLEDDLDKSSEQLRAEIEDTREELGDTVEALTPIIASALVATTGLPPPSPTFR